MHALISELHWQTDFSGEDCGYYDIDIVGVYTSYKLNVDLLIDMDTFEVLEITTRNADEIE